MRIHKLFLSVLCLLGLVAARAAAPTVQVLQLPSVVLGDRATLQAGVSDSDGDLLTATFLVSGPAMRDFLNAGAITWPPTVVVDTVNIAGSQASPAVYWQPPQAGTYAVSVLVTDGAGHTFTQTGTFECVTGRLVVPPVTIASGVNRMYLHSGEIITTQNQTTSNVIVQSGGSLLFWAGGRVTLKPGFRATSGAFFWAAVDHGMTGYSDIEKVTDTDGDGMPDAWEVDHGLNMLDPSDANQDPDGDGLTNLQEYRTGRDPHNSTDGLTVPGNVQLVLRTPANGYYRVNTSTWEIQGP